MANIELSIGCDPEVFLTNEKGQFISAHGMFPGTKDKPFKVEKGAIQVDGLALEFNIDPAKTPEEFDENIETVLTQMKEMVAKVDKGLKIEFTPIANFDAGYFDTLPVNSKILGCDPDFSAINGEVIEKVVDITNMPVRTAAGHAHIGWTKDEDAMSPAHFEDCRFIANHFYNLWNFQPLTAAERNRLHYYGFYGAFRPKTYGVELRQPSNLWVKDRAKRKTLFQTLTSEVLKLYKD